MNRHEFPALAVPRFPSATAPRRSTAFDRWLLGCIQRTIESAPIRLALWDGLELMPTSGPPVGTILVRNRQALLGWALNPDLNFGEAFMSGAIEIHGDLVRTLEAGYRALMRSRTRRLWRIETHSLDAARENVHQHYDLGNEFYRLWLDGDLVYTCAYFPDQNATLEEAQRAKMDRVCRKLRLTAGERVVEAGCGWGSLALFMAKHYGVRVRAFNVSAEQVALARERVEQDGLSDRVEIVLDDYRNITGEYDVFVSVGMLEHVGLGEYEAFGRLIDRCLSADGRGLLHFIGRNRSAALNSWIRKRIFPGAYPPTLREVFERILEPMELSVLDVENLRLHYAKTLEHWLERFEESAQRSKTMFDETFVRAWRLYLAGSQAAFSAGSMQLFQVVFARGGSNEVPWTRVSG